MSPSFGLGAVDTTFVTGEGGVEARLSNPRVKLEFVRRLDDDWEDLADLLGIRPDQKARFPRGQEARRIWEWLEVRNRLTALPAALRMIDRGELAYLVERASEVASLIVTRFDTYRSGWDLREIYLEVVAGAASATVDVQDVRRAGGSYADLHFVAHRAMQVISNDSSGDLVQQALSAREAGESTEVHILLVGPVDQCEIASSRVNGWLGPSEPGQLFLRNVPDDDGLANGLAKTIGQQVRSHERQHPNALYRGFRDTTVGGYR